MIDYEKYVNRFNETTLAFMLVSAILEIKGGDISVSEMKREVDHFETPKTYRYMLRGDMFPDDGSWDFEMCVRRKYTEVILDPYDIYRSKRAATTMVHLLAESGYSLDDVFRLKRRNV